MKVFKERRNISKNKLRKYYKTNFENWEKIYSSKKALKNFPDSVLVSISHHHFNVKDHKKVLDYGFGGGANIRYFLSRGFNVSGIEISQSALEYTKELNEKSNFNAELKLLDSDGRIPFEDDYFDLIISWGVLYYNTWKTFKIAVNEINRVLNNGGAFIGTMIKPGDSSFHSNSKPLGKGLYEIKTIAGQEGCIVIIPDGEEELKNCFPENKLDIGNTGYRFLDKIEKHWIINYINSY
tara:strand:- start:6 stop:719 length:714 start_codon:yes stop_codon:yes gene_type:complete